MNRIVVYQSGTGFTAKYAEWIAHELGCEAKKYKSVKTKELQSYDQVIYGGWIMGGLVYGYNKIKELNLSNLVVFGVGMAVSRAELADQLADQNGIPRERFFYYEGGYNPSKVGFMKKLLMNMVKKQLEKKEDKTDDELHMLKTFEGADHTNRKAIKELVEYCR